MAVYPDNFDFRLIEGMNLGPNKPLLNYNNMVMEQHIVDERAIFSKRAPFDVRKLYPDNFKDTQHHRFWNNKYRAQQQELMDRYETPTPFDDSLLRSGLPSSINSGHLIYMYPQWRPRETLPQKPVPLAEEVRIETEDYHKMKARNDFKIRAGPSNLQTVDLPREDRHESSFLSQRVDVAPAGDPATARREQINNFYQFNHKYGKNKRE